MKNLKRWTVAGSAVAAVFGVSMLSGPMAWADSSASITGAKASFKSSGEVFTLDDTKCDGNPVYLLYTVSGGSEHRNDFSGGCDATPAKIDLDLDENKTIKFRVCVNKAAAIDKCSGWSSDKT